MLVGEPISGMMTETWTVLKLRKKNCTNFLFIKDVQVTKEAVSFQKRTSSTLKHEISQFFLLLWVILTLLNPDLEPDSGYVSGSGSTDLIESGSESETQLCKRFLFFGLHEGLSSQRRSP
jgi:hypothetical protein